MNGVEIQASELLLDKGVRVSLRTPFFLRWIGKPEIGIIVKRPMIGTMIRISESYLKLEVDIAGIDAGDIREAHKLIATHGLAVCRIVASGMLRGRISGRLFSGMLAKYLLWHADTIDLARLAMILVSLSGVEHFTNTIRFMEQMKITTPRNLSPEKQGSQQAK